MHDGDCDPPSRRPVPYPGPMAHYQIGELVAVEQAALPPDTAHSHRLRTSEGSPAWLAALIEGIDARPGVAPAARYRVRILEGPCSGRSWPVSICALRPWHRTTPPPSPTVA
jgi:hypothetical protein